MSFDRGGLAAARDCCVDVSYGAVGFGVVFFTGGVVPAGVVRASLPCGVSQTSRGGCTSEVLFLFSTWVGDRDRFELDVR